MKTIYLLGIPFDMGAENLAVSMGPKAFRYHFLAEKLKEIGIKIEDLGDIDSAPRSHLSKGNPNLKYLDEVVRISHESAKKVSEVIKKGEKIVVLGGDHSVCLGAVSGASVALKGDLGLIYFDAHGDMNTDKTTDTGNIHGMHLASLMGFGHKKLKTIHDESIKIDKNNMLHIGGNDLDEAEVELIENENLTTYKISDIVSFGLGPLFKLIDNLKSGVKNIWISLDFDAIDSLYAPGAGIPNKSGLSYREITTIAKFIGEKCNVVGVDIAEYNPLQDIDNKTVELGIELIAKFFGHNYSWYTNYMKQNKMRV